MSREKLLKLLDLIRADRNQLSIWQKLENAAQLSFWIILIHIPKVEHQNLQITLVVLALICLGLIFWFSTKREQWENHLSRHISELAFLREHEQPTIPEKHRE